MPRAPARQSIRCCRLSKIPYCLIPKVLERPDQAAVSPRDVLPGHAQDEAADSGVDPRAPGTAKVS